MKTQQLGGSRTSNNKVVAGAIIDQQIERALGDDYRNMVRRAQNYVATIVRSSWYTPAAKGKMLTAEGGRASLLRTCLCYIIEEQDLDKGLRSFGNYIQREYGDNLASQSVGDNYNASLEYSAMFDEDELRPNLTNITLGQWATDEIEVSLEGLAAEALFGYRPSNKTAVQLAAYSKGRVTLDKIIQNQEELELFQTYGDVGSLAEAIRLIGWPKKIAMTIWHRVHQRAKRWGLR